MRYAIVNDGLVVNVAEADDPDFASIEGWHLVEGLTPEPGIGWLKTTGGWLPPDGTVEPVPASTSDLAAQLEALTAAVLAKTDVTEQDLAERLVDGS